MIPAFTALAATSVVLVAGHRLPNPVAVHFTLDGRPDGTLARATFVGVLLGIPWVSLILTYLLATMARSGAATLSGLVTFVAVGVGVVVLGIGVAISQVDLDSWRATRLSPWWLVAALIVGISSGVVQHRILFIFEAQTFESHSGTVLPRHGE